MKKPDYTLRYETIIGGDITEGWTLQKEGSLRGVFFTTEEAARGYCTDYHINYYLHGKPDTLECCIDCYVYVANAELPADDDRCAAIVLAVAGYADDDYSLHAGDDTTDFSKQPCELCGNHLHGSRHTVVAVPPVLTVTL